VAGGDVGEHVGIAWDPREARLGARERSAVLDDRRGAIAVGRDRGELGGNRGRVLERGSCGAEVLALRERVAERNERDRQIALEDGVARVELEEPLVDRARGLELDDRTGGVAVRAPRILASSATCEWLAATICCQWCSAGAPRAPASESSCAAVSASSAAAWSPWARSANPSSP
jgi:hypothetical protein